MRLRPSLPAAVPEEPAFVESNNNDVWHWGSSYLRVAWRGDRSRLAREALVLDALRTDDVLPVPEVLDVGGDDVLAWAISEAVPGRPLEERCRGTSEDGRDLVRELGALLRDLHRWSPPAPVVTALTGRPGLDGADDPVAIAGGDAIPLPVERALALVPMVRSLPFVDAAVVDAAAARMAELAAMGGELDDRRSVLHGDCYLGNVLVDGDRITGVIDFEFCRLGRPELELVSFVRALDAEASAGIERPPILAWLEAGHPELFAAPDLDRLLWLAELAYTVRQILFWPPDRAVHDGLDPGHPLRTLPRLLDGPLTRAR